MNRHCFGCMGSIQQFNAKLWSFLFMSRVTRNNAHTIKSCSCIVFITFVLNYFLYDFIFYLFLIKPTFSQAALWFDIFTQKCNLPSSFPYHIYALLWETGPPVHQKVFNIYSLIHLTFFFFFGNLLCHHFISYLI